MSESTNPEHSLYLDEDALVLTRELRARAWNVYRCTESRLTGPAATDPRQLREAANLDRVLITYNRRDFRLVHEAWILAGGEHHGILSIHGGRSAEYSDFVDAIDALLRGLSPVALRDSMLVWHPTERAWHRWDD